mgnify:CR=1 FL=1
MRSLPVTQQKRSAKVVTTKDIRTKKAPQVSRVTTTVPKKAAPSVAKTSPSKTSVTTSIRKPVKKAQVSPLRKYKRYAKQGVKSMLLSPLFHSSFKVLTGLLLTSSLLYGSYVYVGKTFANEVVISQSEIISRVSKLTTLPDEEPSEIVRVQDKETLRKQNDFYKDIEEGDYILMYKDMAVIYDLRGNRIVAIKRTNVSQEPSF